MAASNVVDVAEHDFEQAVLAESRRRPVVVDFWAAWCGPCRVLGPILERIANESGGRFLLAKVDTDQAQGQAARYGIRGIPAVKGFVNGQVASEFVGSLPESQVRRWIEALVPGPADDEAAGGERALSDGQKEVARAAFERALALKPGHVRASLALAKLDAQAGRVDEAEARLQKLPFGDASKHESEIAAVRLAIAAARSGGLAQAEARVKDNPRDYDARIALGRALAAQGRHRDALEALLGVVREARGSEHADEARKAMLEVFEVAGSRSELSDEYRTRLARELYR
jgi:putative thioredoxin